MSNNISIVFKKSTEKASTYNNDIDFSTLFNKVFINDLSESKSESEDEDEDEDEEEIEWSEEELEYFEQVKKERAEEKIQKYNERNNASDLVKLCSIMLDPNFTEFFVDVHKRKLELNDQYDIKSIMEKRKFNEEYITDDFDWNTTWNLYDNFEITNIKIRNITELLELTNQYKYIKRLEITHKFKNLKQINIIIKFIKDNMINLKELQLVSI